jgi:glycosyltransferase involved in cell wall biosynthesis
MNLDVRVWTGITPKSAKISVYKVPSLPLPLYPDYPLTLPFGKIFRQLTDFNPDLVQISTPDMVGAAFLKFAKKNTIPVSNCYHTDFPAYLKFYKLGFLTNTAWRYLRWLFNNGDLVCAPTRELLDKLQGNGINRLRIWSRGIHRNRFHPRFRSQTLRSEWKAAGKTVILYSGRFVWYKSLDILIDVYRLTKRMGPRDVKFVLAGDGPVRNELERAMPEAVFTGYLHGNDLSRTYASADLLLFPSTTETFGNVVQEALASGTPAVVSNVGGCKEIVSASQGGYVARAGDAADFHRHCTRLIGDRNLYNEKRNNGLLYADQRDWDVINGDLIQEYKNLIKRNNRPHRWKRRSFTDKFPSTVNF